MWPTKSTLARLPLPLQSPRAAASSTVRPAAAAKSRLPQPEQAAEQPLPRTHADVAAHHHQWIWSWHSCELQPAYQCLNLGAAAATTTNSEAYRQWELQKRAQVSHLCACRLCRQAFAQAILLSSQLPLHCLLHNRACSSISTRWHCSVKCLQHSMQQADLLCSMQAPAAAPAPKVAFEGASESASQFGQKTIEKRAPPPAQQMPEHLPFEGAFP